MSPSEHPEYPLPLPRHGGVDGAKQALEGILEEEILDFSISINPLGPPPGLREALTNALGTISQYPEITSVSLAKKLAAYHGIPADHVIVGNGTADLLFSLIPQLPGNKALIPHPTFVEYERACGIYRWEIRHIPPRNTENFAFDPDEILRQIQSDTTLFLCQPNNPTGRCLDPETIAEILKRVKKTGAYVILDEAFLPFTGRPSFISQVRRQPRLIVLRSMTKSYAIPGLRLGYACASPEIISRWASFLPPWNVNSLAQAAGIYCLEHGEPHLKASRAFIHAERKRVTQQIERIASLSVLPSEANFFLVAIHSESFTADFLYPTLAKRGILVRHCGSFRGMGSHHIRIGLKSEAENQKLIDVLRETVQVILSKITGPPSTTADYVSRK
jgi:threonine-phosphate decarboxylase